MLAFIKVFLSVFGEFSRAFLWIENLLFHAGGTVTVVCELHTYDHIPSLTRSKILTLTYMYCSM